MNPPEVHGLVPVLATPFDVDGALDIPSLHRLVDFQLAAGAQGLAVFGMASEGFALTPADRTAILAQVREAAGPQVPLVAGVNATSTANAVAQAQEALQAGADALMVLPPYLVRPSAAQLGDFYGEVAAAAGRHVMVQDAPGATGVTMSVPLIVELSKLEHVASVKIEAPPTAPKVGEVVSATDAGFMVFGGQNALFVLEEYARGAVGTMPACEFTDVLAGVLAEWAAGHRLEAHRAFARLLPLVRFGMQPQLAWAVHKEVLVRRGIITSATVRDPAVALDRESGAALDELLAAAPLPPWRPS